MLELHHICKRFGETEALNGIDLQIKKGELTFVVGESGSGKTTLLQLLGGTEAPSEGEILFCGKNIAKDTTAYRAKHVGFVYQDFNLIPGLTIKENIVLGSCICGKEVPEERLQEIMTRLALLRATQEAQTLSGGEKQRVAIARALLKDAEIILADEPTGNLDPDNADKIFTCLRELRRDRYIVVVTHDHERAYRYGDRVISLQHGKITRDEQIDREAPAPEKEKSRAPAPAARHCPSPIAMLAKNSLKRRWVRMLTVAIVLALTMATLAMAFDLQGLGNQVEKNVNIGYLETDMLHVMKTFSTVDKTFSPEEIANIPNIDQAVEVVETYQKWNNFSFSTETAFAHDSSVKCVKWNEFFRERLGTNEMEGEFPTSDHEIILAQDIANTLFGGASAIGRQVTMQNGNGQMLTLTVSAVNKTVNPYGNIYSYVSEGAIHKMQEDATKSALQSTIFVLAHWKLEKRMLTQNEELFYGRMPSAPNEILLSHSALVGFSLGKDMPALTLEDVEAKAVPEAVLEEIYNGEYCLNIYDYVSKPLRVVGFYYLEDCDPKGNGNLVLTAGFTDETWQALNVTYPTEVELYFDGVDEAKAARTAIEVTGLLLADTSIQSLQDRVGNWSMLYTVTMLVIGAVLGLILIVLLFAFSRLLLLERKHEIAILRSLGANGKSIFALVFFDFAAIYLIALFLSALLSLLYPVCFSSFLSDISYIRLTYPILSLLAIGGVSLLALGALVCPFVWRMMKITPATLLKTE